MMSSSQSLPDFSLAGPERTLKGKGSFTWDWLLLATCQHAFEESAGDPQHTYPQPLTPNCINYIADHCVFNAHCHVMDLTQMHIQTQIPVFTYKENTLLCTLIMQHLSKIEINTPPLSKTKFSTSNMVSIQFKIPASDHTHMPVLSLRVQKQTFRYCAL